MWLHIISDDKFTPGLIDMFEKAAPDRHQFCLLFPKAGTDLGKCLPINNEAEFTRVLTSRSDWQGIIFNPLPPVCWRWLKHIPAKMRVIWYGWGYEGYQTWPKLKARFTYLEKTKAWVQPKDSLSNKMKQVLDDLKIYYAGYRYLRRVDEFVSLLHHNHVVYQQAGLLGKRTRYRFGAVGSLFDLGYMAAKPAPGKHILFGNSATATNNHMEAIDWLVGKDLDDRKVITPLSYGQDSYRDMICEYAQARLGENFVPVVDYMSFDQYIALLSDCGFMLINTLRPQGFGNILMMLMNGAKLITNDTPALRTLRDWGVHVELMSEATAAKAFTPLTEEQIQQNRMAIQQHASQARVMEQLHEMLGAKSDA
ncbi:hypothetical protein FJ444_18985 [Aestuariibacter sp. GS-14]|uniref:TDP-N-acetylfucosamine:lipid II N-acetylfucosaminyltransferase n=1 Tax=Aestuariibacter sp. GS-14 TaxID=2590670 RepID=UPI00112A15F9|nr:TDP-N-acetylfucosamine:lipid II N-acetylfucosaminyltransferase [Aestuariibacter sp. GS-14]TPV54274.1 hypothetical protein FJ444_18985 [Aestuariibacter sp. GS-14]